MGETTVKELQELWNMEREPVYALCVFLEAAGLITRAKTPEGFPKVRPNAQGKGKGATVYAVPNDLGDKVKKFLDG